MDAYHLAKVRPLGELRIAGKRGDRDSHRDRKRNEAQKPRVEEQLEGGNKGTPAAGLGSSHLRSGDRKARDIRQGCRFPRPGRDHHARLPDEAEVTRALTLF